MRTLTSYGIAVVIVFAILNGIFWLVGKPQLHEPEHILCWVRPRDARDVYCGLALWISAVLTDAL
jgi:hypothetical protein